MLLDELINDVQMYLTFSGAMPKILPDIEIERLIENEAKPYFFREVYESKIKEYLYIPRDAFLIETYTRYKFITLPCTVHRVVWLYQVNDISLFSFGVNAPNLSVNLGVTNQPYLSSITTTIGELSVYKVIIDGFADMLNQLSKSAIKYDFNQSSKQLNILTSMGTNTYTDTTTALIAEVYSQIPDEDLFDNSLFRSYVRASAGLQLGRLLTRYDYTLPGGVKINSSVIMSEAKDDLTKVTDIIKSSKANGIIRTYKR